MGENVHEFTTDNFPTDVLKAETPVLVDFWAPWCAPCRGIAPMIDQLATENVGKAKVGKVNIDENRGIAEEYGISSIPTLLIFKGGEVVNRLGAQSKDRIQQAMDEAAG